MRWLCTGVVWLTWFALGMSREPMSPWKAGVASAVITPKKNVWLAGYAKRTKATAGKVQDLFAKALALEDQRGKRAVILTLDLIGITGSMRDDVALQVEKKFALHSNRLLVNASHTHCSPMVRALLPKPRPVAGPLIVAFEETTVHWLLSR